MNTPSSDRHKTAQSFKPLWSVCLTLGAVMTTPMGCAGSPANPWGDPDEISRSSGGGDRPGRSNREGYQKAVQESHRADLDGTRDRSPEAPSQLLTQSGEAQVGHRMPFFSGWLTHGQILNLTGLLKVKKSRYIITLCASWCAPCFDGLQRLSDAQSKIQNQGAKLVVYVVDSEFEAKKIQRRFNFDWALVLSDPFQSHARKLSSSKSAQRTKTGGTTIELPRTFVLNHEGTIEMIIGQEGNDYIERLLTERD